MNKTLKRLTFLVALAATPAAAHNFGCDGNPVPKDIKLNCCGKADDHVVTDWSQDARGDYHVRVGKWAFVVPEKNALPSADGCAHLFFADRQGDAIAGGAEFRSAGEPIIYCWLVPMVGLGGGGGLDDVDWTIWGGSGGSIAPRGAAAPELSSWAYLALGFFFLLGGKLWNKRRKV